MEDRVWFILATFLYLISAAWGFYALGAGRRSANVWNDWVVGLGFLCHSVFLYARGHAIHHCPITNLFEILVFFSWSLVLTYLVIGSAYRMSILGTFTAPLVFLINFFALITPIDVRNLLPSHGWIVEFHVVLMVMGFGILGVVALAGVAYLIQERQLKRRDLRAWFYTLPPMGELEQVHQRVLLWAFFLFSAGMLMGFFLPQKTMAGGVKLSWSAVVWLWYALLLVAPTIFHWSHKRIAWYSVSGYVFVLLTFWGLHSFSKAYRLSNLFPEEVSSFF